MTAPHDDAPRLDLDIEEPGRTRVWCRCCGRRLTGPARARGIGDDCRAKLDQRTAPTPPRRDTDQDPLPGV